MISDEPDEDADSLDDDAALDTYLAEDAPKIDSQAPVTPVLPDWPSRTRDETGLDIDPETLAWFKAMHVNWRHEIRSVLRGWVAANMASQQDPRAAVPGKDAGRREAPPAWPPG